MTRAVRPRPGAGRRARIGTVGGFVIVAAIAAAITIYFSLLPRVSFEDVIVEDPANVARTTYSPTDNLFWPDGAVPRPYLPETSRPAAVRGKHKHLAG